MDDKSGFVIGCLDEPFSLVFCQDVLWTDRSLVFGELHALHGLVNALEYFSLLLAVGRCQNADKPRLDRTELPVDGGSLAGSG